MNIKKFNSFNENIIGDLSSKIGTTLSELKSKLFGSKQKNELNKFNIKPKKISNTYFQFLHNNRIISELKLDDQNVDNSPVFKLTIYYYDSEIKNVDDSSLKQKFENQKEQPYAKGSKKFFGTNQAVDFLISFWSKKTNSGRSKNSSYKINL